MKLSDKLTSLPFIKGSYASKLESLNLHNIKDLLTYFPKKYIDASKSQQIREVLSTFESNPEENFQIQAQLAKFKNVFLRSRKTLQTAVLKDETGQINASWFNQPFLEKVLKEGETFMFIGKVKKRGSKVAFYPSLFEPVLESRELVHTGRISPEYPLTAGVTKKWFRNRMKYLIDNLDLVELDSELDEFGITTEILKLSLKQMHFPDSFESVEDSISLLTIVELTQVQLKLEEQREKNKRYKAYRVDIENIKAKLDKFVADLPYELTIDQKNIFQALLDKIERNILVNALIQGDVGSGKTIIAILLSFVFALSKKQSIILAPTTILAKQHFDNFSKLLKNFPEVSIDLAIMSKKDTQKADIIIGTTAVLARKQKLIDTAALVIVDEQHRFGVKQREELLAPFESLKKHKFYPHFVNMSATPIPRTIAQSLFGDIEVFDIKTKPKNRKPISTFLVPSKKREANLEWIKEKIVNEKAQVYWVCPLIEDSEAINASSAEGIFKELQEKLAGIRIALLHGKMKPSQKQDIMAQFANREYDLLVSTSVIEVGVDVTNASIMVIESSERFGLAQLHQIRGRVGRGETQSFCFMYTNDESKKERLEFVAKTNDGMRIAEYDLAHRGPGEVYGTAQTGVPNLKIAQLDNADSIRKSRILAQKLYNSGVKEIKLFT